MDQSLRSKWDAGAIDRQQVLERARRSARVTSPYLAPDEYAIRGRRLEEPLSALGGRGTTNLAAKLLAGSFPTEHPFFRYEINQHQLQLAGVRPDQYADVQLALSKRVRAIQGKLDRIQVRRHMFEAYLHLINAGNYLLQYQPDGALRGFSVDKFIVRRDGSSQVRSLLVREIVHRSSLPEAIREHAAATEITGRADRNEVDLFTYSERQEDGTWTSWQEAGGKQVGARISGIKDLDFPWQGLRIRQ